MSLISNAGTEVYGTYLDVQADVKPWLQIPPDDTADDASLQLLTDMLCEHVQNWLGRPIARKRFDRRFDGWSTWTGAHLMLPFWPVLEVVSVTEFWGAAGPHSLQESTPTNQTDGWQVVPETGRITRVFPGNVQKPWFPGTRNIEIVWEAGYNPIPNAIRGATLELIAHWFWNTQQVSALRGPGLNAASEAEPATLNGLWQGMPNRITALLSPYINTSLG